MGFIIAGAIATAFSFIVIKAKLERKRWYDAILDLFALIILGVIFAGTVSGMAIAMIASTIVSIYLWFFPPKIPEPIQEVIDDLTSEPEPTEKPKRKRKKKKRKKKRSSVAPENTTLHPDPRKDGPETSTPD